MQFLYYITTFYVESNECALSTFGLDIIGSQSEAAVY